MYNIEIREHIFAILKKLQRKNKKQLEIINKKLKQILDNPYQFKPLKSPLQNIRRVHIDKSFVLLYSIDESRKVVILENYDHHDNIYRKPLAKAS